MFVRKPGLRHCGAGILTSVLRPKFVYALAFAKAKVPAAEVEAAGSGYGNMLRSSMSVAKEFPWGVLAGSADYEGLSASGLATEVTKTRLRMFHQAMAVSRFTSENDMAKAMLYVAQRWYGASTPINMLRAGKSPTSDNASTNLPVVGS